MSALKKISNFLLNHLSKVFSFVERYAAKIKVWLLTPVPRYRTIIATTAFIATMTVALLYGGSKIFAATFTWTQTNWASQTANTTGHPAPANWTEYSAKDSNLSLANSGADLQVSTQTPTWTVTDDGTTDSGFNNAGAVKSNTTVSGTGSGAGIQLAGNFSTGTGANGVFNSSTYNGSSISGITGTSPNITINTTNAPVIDTSVTPNQGVYNFTSFTIASGDTVTVTGSNALVIRVTGTATVSGTLSANGGNGTAGGYLTPSIGGSGVAGGSSGSNGTGITPRPAPSGSGAGGGGGGNYYDDGTSGGGGGFGGGGGNGTSLSKPSGFGGSTYGTSALSTLVGGSGGGGASGYAGDTWYGGAGGGGGGAIKMSANSITVGGTARANGGDGGRNNDPFSGGGGGSAGAYLIQGNTVNISGSVTANGGAGATTGNYNCGGGGGGGRIRIESPSITGLTNAVANYGAGGSGTYCTGTNGSAGTVSSAGVYYSSGTFTSHGYDTTGNTSLGTLSWTATTPTNTSITIKARSGNQSNLSDATAWASCTNITSGAALSTGGCVTNGHRYLQFQATLSTTDTSATPTLSDVSLTYTNYPTTAQTLTSSSYNSSSQANIISRVSWNEDVSLPASANIQFQLRTAPDSSGSPGTWSSWAGPDGTSSTYFSNSGTGCSKVSATVTCTTIPSAFKDGLSDQWMQYKVFLTASAIATPTLSDVGLQYVVNTPPQFNPTNGLVVAQVSDSADANWGKIRIDYSVRDTDTSSGTTDPGYVTPSFQYNIGGGWVTINSAKLSTDATLHKVVNGATYTAYTAYWDAQTDIANNYLTTAQVKVTVDDREAANNTASSTSSNFTLDTKVPTVSAFKIDSTLDQLTLTSADDSVLQYRISNNSNLSADGSNSTSGAWQSPAVNSISLTPSWTFTGAPSYETAYLQVRDALGNVSSATAVAPSTPGNMYIQDISNIGSTTYKEFISWDVFVPATGTAFSSYKVYRSTDGSSYSLLATVSDVNTNYYVDSAVSLNSTYYYKVRVTDTDTDIGNYGAVVNDKVDGQGGTDTTAPSITSVTVTEQQATYATVTWTTDELANSEVDYSISPSTAFGTVSTVSSYVTAHSVTIANLSPNTTYLFRVKSADILGNTATNNNGGTGFTITTIGGPIISNVTETEVNEHSATIFWNTNTDSDSHVSFSVSSSLSSPTRSGSNTRVGGPPYQHKVSLSGLTSGAKYYYFVESTDASSNNSKDTNGNNYYSFTTTSDTKAPIISAVSAPVSSLNAAVVVWNTDEAATGIVDYGTVSGTYPSSTTLNSSLTIFHIGSLSKLTENTKYYYRVRSSDNAGNEATSAEYNFTTDQTHTVTVAGGGGGIVTPPVVLDTTPPVITNITAKDIKSFTATVSFETSEDSVGFVDYGVDSANLNLTSGDSSYSKSHEIKLTGLTMGKKYTFTVKAVDKSGNIATSPIGDLTTKFFTESTIQLKDTEAFQKEVEDAIESALPSLVPPFVSNLKVSNITDSSASVTWTTNIKSFSVVAYVSEDEFDSAKTDPYTIEVSNTTDKVLNHQLELKNLKPDTRYHVMARSFSLPEVVGKSKDLTFITEALKIRANIGSVTNNSFKAVWTTTEPTTSVVEYRNMKTGELNQKSSETKTTAHEILVDNLTPGTSYAVNVFGYNEKDNKISIASSVDIKTSIDTIAPKITSLTIDSALIPDRADRAQTIVSWKTNEPSTSTVFFKEGVSLPDEKLTNKVEITNNFVINHAVVVSSLKPGGLYSIQVSSTDAAGNVALFPIRTALVPEQSQSVVEIIFKNFEDTFRFLRQ